jgi:hypothetical protein
MNRSLRRTSAANLTPCSASTSGKSGKNRYDVYRYNLNHLKRCFIGYEGAYTDVAWPSILWKTTTIPAWSPRSTRAKNTVLHCQTACGSAAYRARNGVSLSGQELGAVNVPFTGIGELRESRA